MDEQLLRAVQEPFGKDIWYSRNIASVYQKHSNNSTLNRYKTKLRLSSNRGVSVIEFIKKSQIYLPPSDEDQIYYVDASKKHRPDLIAQEVYGTSVLYWVVLSCNDLRHPFELDTGLTIRLPKLNDIIHDRRIL